MEHYKNYERIGDNSPGKVLVICKSSIDDISVSIVDYEDHCATLTVDFTAVAFGGGKSPKVREALRKLADAIEEDNKVNPTAPTPFYNPKWHQT